MIAILRQMEEDKKYIEGYPLTSTTGTKKMMQNYHRNAVSSRNAYINNKKAYYTSLQEKVLTELSIRYGNLLPQDSSNDYTTLKEDIATFQTIVKYNNKYNDVYEKLDFDKIVGNISDSDVSNLERVSSLIDRIFDLFRDASITLTLADFDYSMYTTAFMEVYFNSRLTETFKDDMVQIFDKLYWECPLLLTHIKLCIRNLYTKYEKPLTEYYQKMMTDLLTAHNTTPETVFNTYNQLFHTLEERQHKDPYLLSVPFLNNTIYIDDYKEDSPQRKKHFDRFFLNRTFLDLSDEEKEDFLVEVENLKHVVVELNHYNKYKSFVKDLISRYKQKDTYKGIYQNKLKEIASLEKERAGIYSHYQQKETGFLFFKKKTNQSLLKVQMNELIKKLDALYIELDDAKVNEMIATKLDDASTINDGLEVVVSFYPYFKKLCAKLETDDTEIDYIQMYTDLFSFVYDTNNTFIRKVKLLDDSDINTLIYEKYKLLNINITKEDLEEGLESLEESIDYINLLNHIDHSSISRETIKFLVEYQKLKKN